MYSSNRPTAFTAQLEVLQTLGLQTETLIERHSASRNDWQPGELIDFGDSAGLDEMRQLRERAAALGTAVRVAVALNMLTEEGLPNFHRIIAAHVGEIPAWDRWMRLWTAEEDRHGNVLRDYARDAALYDMARLDTMQFEYLRAGFDPEWAGSPYRLVAYTSLQERATQIAHANTARACAGAEPQLQRILAHLASDELRHCAFYRDNFALLLEVDPDNALLELATVAPALGMPGQTIPGYLMMAEIEREAGIFGPREYATLVDESLQYWDIEHLEPHGGTAREARDTLLELPARLHRLADLLDTRKRRKTYEFDFLRAPLAALESTC